MSTSDGSTRGHATHLAKALVGLADAKPTERVLLLGSEQIEILLALWGRGFRQVQCRAANGGPNAGEDSADVVIAPSVDGEAKLLAVLARAGRSLRPGGKLLLAAALSAPSSWRRRMRKLLIDRGYAVAQSLDALGTAQLLCCRRLAAARAEAA